MLKSLEDPYNKEQKDKKASIRLTFILKGYVCTLFKNCGGLLLFPCIALRICPKILYDVFPVLSTKNLLPFKCPKTLKRSLSWLRGCGGHCGGEALAPTALTFMDGEVNWRCQQRQKANVCRSGPRRQ